MVVALISVQHETLARSSWCDAIGHGTQCLSRWVKYMRRRMKKGIQINSKLRKNKELDKESMK
jgi:hypothetical protein